MNIVRIQGDAEKRLGIYYELDKDGPFLGEGGMGRVYKGFCVDMRTGQRSVVAIKAVHESIQSPQLLERARREASIQIENENLMKMYGFIENPEQLVSGAWVNRYYMPMELLVGVSLDDLIRGVTTDQNGLRIPYAEEIYSYFRSNSVAAIAMVAKSILAGIMAMHNKGFIHRDIDPSNVMITLDRKIKLIDFGICKQINTLATMDKHLTASGTFIGKVNYAAPELVLGDVKSQNQTTDIYAIGVLLYQLYTGRLPFEGSDEHVLYCHLRKAMPLKDIKNQALRKIIKKATEKSQEKRYASAAEMIVDLERLLSKTYKDGESVQPQPGGKGKLVAGIAAGVTVVAAAVAAIVLLRKPEPVEPVLPPPTLAELYAQAVSKIAPGQPDSLVLQGREEMYRLAKDSSHTESIMKHYDYVLSEKDMSKWEDAYAMVEKLAVRDSLPEAMFECAMTTSLLIKSLPENEIYGFINEPDPTAAVVWLEAVLEKQPANPKAMQYALFNYIQINTPAVHKEKMLQHYTNFAALLKLMSEEEVNQYKKSFEFIQDSLWNWGIINTKVKL